MVDEFLQTNYIIEIMIITLKRVQTGKFMTNIIPIRICVPIKLYLMLTKKDTIYLLSTRLRSFENTWEFETSSV